MDAVIYVSAVLASIAALFLRDALGLRKSSIVVLLLLVAGYAAPYWVSFSHPTYHMPVMPLLMIPAAAMLAWRPSAQGIVKRDAVLSLLRKRAFVICTVIFLYVQAEWTWVMARGLLGR
jgi:hypothetical protein